MVDATSRVRSINPFDKQFQRRIRKEHIKEMQQEERMHDSLLQKSQNNYNIFDNKEEIHSFDKHIGQNIENMHLEDTLGAELRANTGTLIPAQNLTRKYLAPLDTAELDLLWDAVEDKATSQDDANKLCDELEKCLPGTELVILDSAMSKIAHKAGIYLSLCHVLDVMRQRGSKPEFQKQLEDIAAKFAAQESSFLFEFFSLTKNPALKDKCKSFNLNAIAKVNSGAMDIQTLRQTIQFIQETFKNQYPNIVSIYMKVRADQLNQLKNLNFETRQQFIVLFKFARNLMLAHTYKEALESLIKKFTDEVRASLEQQKTLVKAEIKISDNLSKNMLDLLDFFNSISISDSSVNNLVTALGIKLVNSVNNVIIHPSDPSMIKRRLLSNIREMVMKLPQDIFNGVSGRHKFSAFIQNLLEEYSAVSKTSGKLTSGGLTFLNSRAGKLINYV